MIEDCRSFPSRPIPCDLDQTFDRPDFCLGTDSFHTPQELIQTVVSFLESSNYSVLVDVPYRGTLVPLEFYQREPRVVSIMVEARRDLYMNETSGAKNDGFDETKNVISELLQLLSASG